jgi:broad specificity phosphatase PhoE
MRVYEAFERLSGWGMVKNMTGDGSTYHLTSKGREGAEQVRQQLAKVDFTSLQEVEKRMPALFAELRTDLATSPLMRELILADHPGDHGGKPALQFYYSSHPNLGSMIDELVKEEWLF